jgi:hypothetical protein
VKVVLGKQCTLNDFVSVINICLADEHKRYAWIQDSIFLLSPIPPSPEPDYSLCGLITENLEPPAKQWWKEVSTIVKENWLILSSYLALLFFSTWSYQGKSQFYLQKKN